MNTISDTAKKLYEVMSHTGTLLPSFMINDENRDNQTLRLSLISGLFGMAKNKDPDLDIDTLTPDSLYLSLSKNFQLEEVGIYAFDELLNLLSVIYDKTINPPYPPLLIPTPKYKKGEPLAICYGIDLKKFTGKLSGRKRTMWGKLLSKTKQLAQEKFPWREGQPRESNMEPFVIGPAPEEPKLPET